MNIAYASASPIPSYTASSVHVMKMCSAFARAGHRVRLFCRPDLGPPGDIFRLYGVEPSFEVTPVRWPRMRGVGGFVYAREVARQIRLGSPPDLVYGRHALTLLLAARQGHRVIFESHAAPENRLQRGIEARLLESPHLVRHVVISDALRRHYLQVFPWLTASTIHVAHDAADEPTPSQGEGQGLPSAALRVGYAGSLGPGRGVDLIVEAATTLPDVQFSVFGGEPQAVAWWKSRSQAANLQFHGFVDHGALSGFLSAMDILVAPYSSRVYTAGGTDSTRWMSPMKLFEYMATGRPIICSDIPVLREVLAHEVNALLVPPDETSALCQAIDRLRDPQLRITLGLAARDRFRSRHTWSARAANVLPSTPEIAGRGDQPGTAFPGAPRRPGIEP